MTHRTITRRDFTKKVTGSAIGIGCVAAANSASPASAQIKRTPVALQLYTVRELTGKDFAGTLGKVAKMGYDAVEFAGYGGLAAKDMKKLLGDLGLVCAGTHEGFDRLDTKLGEVIEYNRTIGNEWLVCPSMPEEWSGKGADGFRAFAERLNVIGEKARQAGMRLCYHNHSFEFKKADGKYLLDILLDAADPKLVGAEVDVYWVKHGGDDPVAFITRHAGRCPLIHMKDMTGGSEPTDTPVGTGILDMKGIIRASRKAGARWFIVEQDTPKQPILGAVETSLKNMRELLKA
jgi:sugar phosphate isomerase/epimerase